MLACLLCAGQARRVQNSQESSDPDSREYLAELLFALQPSVAGVAARQRSQPAQMDFFINDAPPTQELAAIGSKFPDIDLDFGFGPPEKINMPERLKGKRVLVVGLPGAFTPT